MIDPTDSLAALQELIDNHVQELAECKDLDQRVKLSQIIQNLTESVGMYLNFAANMAMSFEDDEMDEDMEF
jgi:hypothetical protein